MWNMKKLQKLVLLTSWLSFHYVEQSLYAAVIPTVCNKLPTKKVAAALVCGVQSHTIIDPQSLHHFFKHVSDITSEQCTWTLEFLLHRSPKMQAMLPILQDQVIVHEEKVIMWTQFPAKQVYVAATLYNANIPAEVFHTGLSVAKHSSLVQRFTQEPHSYLVLVCSYSMNTVGLNLQNLCHNVHLFSTGLSKSITNQAIGQVCCIRQQHIILVYKYHLENSFNDMLITCSHMKSIPGLIAEMEQDQLVGDGSLEIGCWVVHHDTPYQLADGETSEEGDLTDSESVINALIGLH